MKILIVGAGPTGLTAAVELARRGIIADIIDRKDEPSSLSRAVGILPASMEILEPSGVAEAIRSKALVVKKAIFHFDSQRLLTLDLTILDNPVHRMLSLAQDQTEQCLIEGLQRYGGTVRFGTALERFEQNTDKVIAVINGTPSNYDYMIGADGVHSLVREKLDIEFQGFDLPGKWSIADVDVVDWPYPDAFSVFLRPQAKNVVAIPLGPGRLRVVSNTEDAVSQLPIKPNVRNVRRSGVFQISVRQAVTYQQGRIFLAGDAAHCHSPVGGRGMNLGIADAADLAQRLAEGETENYTAVRHARGKDVIAFSEQSRNSILTDSRFKGLATRLILRLTDISPALQRMAVRKVLGV